MQTQEVIEQLRVNYFDGQGIAVRVPTDGVFGRIIVLVHRPDGRRRLFGIRLVDYPASPPTLRFWRPERWEETEYEFDFTSTGDPGSGTTEHEGVATMCIPYHVDYYRSGWHTDNQWVADQAEMNLADLVVNIMRRV